MVPDLAPLRQRATELENVIKEKTQALQVAPDGTLNLVTHGDKNYYYRRLPSGERLYLSTKDTELIRALCQKDFDRLDIQASQKELLAYQRFFRAFPSHRREDIYRELPPGRKRYVVSPYPDAGEWASKEYPRKGFARESAVLFSQDGTRVRSKSEIIIADLLFRNGIPYRYEYPLSLPEFGKVHPDFLLYDAQQEREIIWEHLGSLDNPGYCQYYARRIAAYERIGYLPGDTLVVTFEEPAHPFGPRDAQKALINVGLLAGIM